MVTSTPKNWKVYCKATFKSLCAILEDWDTNDEDVVRITTRIYYEGVFSCGHQFYLENHLVHFC